jgi:hypothetical protein
MSRTVIQTFTRNEAGRLRHLGTELPDGPWHAEPDRVELEHGGIPCLLLRGPRGAWCGYVGLPVDHPWAAIDLIRRGGTWDRCHVTYQRGRPPSDEPPPEADRPIGDAQWIGFACSEEGDLALDVLTLGLRLRLRSQEREIYRELAFAEREVRRLADLALAALPS